MTADHLRHEVIEKARRVSELKNPRPAGILRNSGWTAEADALDALTTAVAELERFEGQESSAPASPDASPDRRIDRLVTLAAAMVATKEGAWDAAAIYDDADDLLDEIERRVAAAEPPSR